MNAEVHTQCGEDGIIKIPRNSQGILGVSRPVFIPLEYKFTAYYIIGMRNLAPNQERTVARVTLYELLIAKTDN